MNKAPKRLRKLTLINFQSHENTTVEFSGGLNAIIGATDSGKSALASRGIRWICYNKPAGTDYIRLGTDRATGIAEFDDGTIIKRVRGATSGNIYEITWPDGRVQRFENFGINPPEEVFLAHGMLPVSIAGEELSLNMAEQLDGPFLLQSTPSARADVIGAIAHAEVIDFAIKDVNSDIRSIGISVSKLDKDMIDIEQQLFQYSDLDEKVARLEAAQALFAGLQDLTRKADRTEQGIQSIREASRRLEQYEQTIARYAICEQLSTQLELVQSKLSNYRLILSTVNRLAGDQDRLEQVTRTIARLQGVAEMAEQVEALRQMLARAQSIREKISLLNITQKKQLDLETVLSQTQRSADALSGVEGALGRVRTKTQIEGVLKRLSGEQQRAVKGEQVIESIRQDISDAVVAYQDAVQQFGKCPICFHPIESSDMARIQQSLL